MTPDSVRSEETPFKRAERVRAGMSGYLILVRLAPKVLAQLNLLGSLATNESTNQICQIGWQRESDE